MAVKLKRDEEIRTNVWNYIKNTPDVNAEWVKQWANYWSKPYWEQQIIDQLIWSYFNPAKNTWTGQASPNMYQNYSNALDQNSQQLNSAYANYYDQLKPSQAQNEVESALLDKYLNPINSQQILDEYKQNSWLEEANKALWVYWTEISTIEEQQKALQEYLEQPWLWFTNIERWRIWEARWWKLRDQLADMQKWYETAFNTIENINNQANEYLKLRQADRDQEIKWLEKAIELLEVSDFEKEMLKMELDRSIKQSQKKDELVMTMFKHDLSMKEFYDKVDYEAKIKLEDEKRKMIKESNLDLSDVWQNKPLALDKIMWALTDIVDRPEYKWVPISWWLSWTASEIYDMFLQWYDYSSMLSMFVDKLNTDPMVLDRYNKFARDKAMYDLDYQKKQYDLLKAQNSLYSSWSSWSSGSDSYVEQMFFVDEEWNKYDYNSIASLSNAEKRTDKMWNTYIFIPDEKKSDKNYVNDVIFWRINEKSWKKYYLREMDYKWREKAVYLSDTKSSSKSSTSTSISTDSYNNESNNLARVLWAEDAESISGYIKEKTWLNIEEEGF